MKFALVEDVYDEQVGSRYAHYRKDNQDVRLVWDGKEEWLVLESRSDPEIAWHELAIEQIGRKTADDTNILSLRTALRRYIH